MTELTCPECGEELCTSEEWQITDRSLIGTLERPGESSQGVYGHAECIGGAA